MNITYLGEVYRVTTEADLLNLLRWLAIYRPEAA